METTLNNTFDYSVWGVAAQGGHLYIGSRDTAAALDRSVPWVFDVENDSNGSCAGIGITTNGQDVYFFDGATSETLARDFFANIKLVAHNAKYDVQMLRAWGFKVSPDQIVWDTAIAEYVKDSTSNTYGLKDLVKQRYNAAYPEFEELVGKGKKAVEFSTLPPDVQANYNGCDVFFTHRLMTDQQQGMTPEQINYLQTIEIPCMRVLLEMEERGVQIDADYIRNLDAGLAADIERSVNGLRDAAGAQINLNSYVQIKQLLVDKAGIKVQSTDAKTLKNFAHIPLVKDILRYRELNKLRSTYTSVLLEKAHGQKTYRLHARFNQVVTHTGRLSSSRPNLQNIPTRTDEGDAIRRGFVRSGNNKFIDADYSQIEPRLMAHMSQDPVLLAIFREGRDLYDTVAKEVGCTRQIAKILWLAMAYNAGVKTISRTASIAEDEAAAFLSKMKKLFKVFFYWCERTQAQAGISKHVKTLLGRVIPIGYDMVQAAPNYIIQGSAAEINKLGLIATRDLAPILNVHDEIAFESDAEISAEIARRLESVVQLSVPIKVEVGSGMNWSEAKS